MYGALVEGKYPGLRNAYLVPAFQNLFRKNDNYENYEAQTNQAAVCF
jgi:hypothetical protein